jgi:hypothetical protein
MEKESEEEEVYLNLMIFINGIIKVSHHYTCTNLTEKHRSYNT